MELAVEKYRVTNEPYYLPIRQEVELFEAAYAARLPVMLKGPTGCGKTRFVEYMAYKLNRPLITVACHEDLSSTDLVGRFLLEGEETVWHDGPLTTAVRNGAICYLDEVVEARKDTVVIIHPLTDDRRRLPIITGLSSTYLYRTAREYGPDDVPDDVRGGPAGHFVVISGYDRPGRKFLVADPYAKNPYSPNIYWLNVDRVVGSILLGIVTHDANLLVIHPPVNKTNNKKT